MKLTLDSLPQVWREIFFSKVLVEGEDVILMFFCGYWGMEKPEALSVSDYLNKYEFAVATTERIIKLPPGWGEGLTKKPFAVVLSDGEGWDARYRDIQSYEKQRYMQCSDIIIQLQNKEVRLEKCQHMMADKLYKYLETKVKGVGFEVKVKLDYSVEWGPPVSFQVVQGTKEMLNVMFVKPSSAPHTPPTARVAQYQDGMLVKEYILEPKRG